jgi:hypothetical protein
MKRLIRAEFFESRDPGGDFIEVFKNPNNTEVDKVRNSNAYKSLNGLITPNNDVYIWRGDLNWDQLNISAINVNNGIQFSFFPNWIFNVNNTMNFEAVYNILQGKKSILSIIGDVTKAISINGTTDAETNYGFNNWTDMNTYYDKIQTEVTENVMPIE